MNAQDINTQRDATGNISKLKINTAHSDRWQCTFSNIPGVSQEDIHYYDLFVKGVTFPDYTMKEINSDFRGFRVRHQVAPDFNIDLSQVSIEFKLSEDYFNYLKLFEYMRGIRYGQAVPTELEGGMIRKHTIKVINIQILDNQKRNIATMKLTEAFLLSISSLPLTTGSSDEITFTCNFSYEELKYTTTSILS